MIRTDNIDDLPFDYELIDVSEGRTYINTIDSLYMEIRGMKKLYNVKYIVVDNLLPRHSAIPLLKIEKDFDVHIFFRTKEDEYYSGNVLLEIKNDELIINAEPDDAELVASGIDYEETNEYKRLINDAKVVFGMYPIDIVEFLKKNSLEYRMLLESE